MRHLKTYENSVDVNTLFIRTTKYEMLEVKDEFEGTFKVDSNGDYISEVDFTFEEYITEKINNKRCKFYCNTCWEIHEAIVSKIRFDNSSHMYDYYGPVVDVKITDKNGIIVASDSTDYHNMDQDSTVTIFDKESELSKEHERTIAMNIESKKFNL